MIISRPIEMRIEAFGDEAFSLLSEQFKKKNPIVIGDKEFIATNVSRNFRESETKECCSQIEEIRRVADLPWNGEGMPPAGVICEIRAHKLNDWSPAIIKFASRNVVVWDWEAEPALNGLCTAYAHAIEIRPIRTPEQIAAEERDKAISDMLNIFGSSTCDVESISAIYDAGYRKQPKE